MRTPPKPWHDPKETPHVVQFYEGDDVLIDSIKKFIADGDVVIIIATSDHRTKLEHELKVGGLDLESARRNGIYSSFDADETLAHFMNDAGRPNPIRFFDVIGSIITRATENKRKVRAYGEMVALLWERGNTSGALELEELWNILQKAHVFSLLCAYPAHIVDSKKLPHIRKTHSKIVGKR